LGQQQVSRITLTYEGFEHFLVQVAIFSHSKPVTSDLLVLREMENQARQQRVKRKKEAWAALGFKEDNFKLDPLDEDPLNIEDLRHKEPTESIISFINILKQQARIRKFNITLFDDPDAALGDSAILKALNDELAYDPDTELPDGYIRKKERKVEFVYHLPLNLPVEESFRVVYSVVDQFLFDVFDFHIIEPISLQYAVTEVRPI